MMHVYCSCDFFRFRPFWWFVPLQFISNISQFWNYIMRSRQKEKKKKRKISFTYVTKPPVNSSTVICESNERRKDKNCRFFRTQIHKRCTFVSRSSSRTLEKKKKQCANIRCNKSNLILQHFIYFQNLYFFTFSNRASFVLNTNFELNVERLHSSHWFQFNVSTRVNSIKVFIFFLLIHQPYVWDVHQIDTI